MSEYENKTGLPSVTTIVDALVPFAAKKFAYKPEYSIRGSIVHDVCALILTLKNEFEIKGHVNKVEDQCKNYIKSFVEWEDLYNITPLFIEKRLASEELGFTGQPDVICKMKGRDGIGIMDWKTSYAKQPPWEIQTAAYAALAEKQLGLEISWTSTVRLRKKGTKVLENIYKGWRNAYSERFIPLLNLHKEFYG